MPPKVTDTRPSAETLHRVEEATAAAARRIVASYAEDLLDGATLMSMLGVEPEGLVHKALVKELEEAAPKKATKRKATKKTAKKTTTKKATKKTAAKKTTKKAATKKTTTKATSKKTTKKAAKKTTKKATS